VTYHQEWRRRRALSCYTALRLAVIFEAYAFSCYSLLESNANAPHDPDSEFPEWTATLPKLDPLPDDPEGWRAIDTRIAARALNFDARIRGSQSLISSTIEFQAERLGDTLARQISERGLEAWNIAVDLRRENGLQAAELVWDYADSLQVTLDQAVRREREEQQRRGEAMKFLSRIQ